MLRPMLALHRSVVVAAAARSPARMAGARHVVLASALPNAIRRSISSTTRTADSRSDVASSAAPSSAAAHPASPLPPPERAPAILLDGIACSDRILDDIGSGVRALLASGRASRPPGLAVLLATAARDSARYVERKSLQARRVGFDSRTIRFDERSVTTEQILASIAALNADESVDGILVQLPLPPQVDTPRILAAVQPIKDVDCFHPANIGNLALFAARERREEKQTSESTAAAADSSAAALNQTQSSHVGYHPWSPRIAALSSRSSSAASAASAASAELGILRDAASLESAHTVFHVPCTPKACMSLLDSYGIPLAGKHVVVLGRSASVGLPLTLLMLNRCATVTNIDATTPEEEARALCATADVVISAVGVAHMIDETWIKAGATVVDVGINFVPTIPTRRATGAGEATKTSATAASASSSASSPASPAAPNPADTASNLRLVGDVDFARVVHKAGHLSPVPGGVGPMTVAMLMDNTMRSWIRWVAREGAVTPADTKNAGSESSAIGGNIAANPPRPASPAEPPLPMLFISGGPGAGKGTQANMLMSHFGSQSVRGADGNDAPIAPSSQHGLIELEDGRRFTLAHISVGALLRQQMQPAGSVLKLPPNVREEIAQTLQKGGILAGHITVQLLRAEIERLMAEHAAAIAAITTGLSSSSSSPLSHPPRLAVVIDGFPRSWDNIVEFERHFCALRHVLLLDVPRNVMQQRLQSRGRDDDRPDVIARRMKGYEEQTVPTLRAFQQQVEAATTASGAADAAASPSQTAQLPPRSASSYSVVDGTGSIPAVYARVEPVLLQFLRSQQTQ